MNYSSQSDYMIRNFGGNVTEFFLFLQYLVSPENVTLIDGVYIQHVMVAGIVDFKLSQIISVLIVIHKRRLVIQFNDFIGWICSIKQAQLGCRGIELPAVGLNYYRNDVNVLGIKSGIENRPAELYSEACRSPAKMLDTLVAIVRLPCNSEPLLVPPDVLSFNFGSREMDSDREANIKLKEKDRIKDEYVSRVTHDTKSHLNDNVQIDIIDTGIGIPAEDIGHVFEEFFRAGNARKNEKDGTGLGLSIVKQIVEQHGGKISVESREGRGTKFTVTIPKDGPTPVCT